MWRDDRAKIGRSGRQILPNDKAGFGPVVPRVESRDANFEVKIVCILHIHVTEAIGGILDIAAARYHFEPINSDRRGSAFDRVARCAHYTVTGKSTTEGKDAAGHQGITHLCIAKRVENSEAGCNAYVEGRTGEIRDG